MTEATNLQSDRTFAVDPEHGGFRVVVFGAFAVTAVIAYLVLTALISSDGINIIAIIGCLLIAFGVSAALERLLRNRWPSGRQVRVHDDGVHLSRHGQIEQKIDGQENASILTWRFQTKRRTRVPKGWYVMACAVEQENRYLSVYTFMSPDDVKNYARGEQFTTLISKKDTTKVQGRDALLLAGQQRRLLEAENRRWIEGAEMTTADFKTYVEQISSQFPEWTR